VSARLQLELAQERYRPGETVKGSVLVLEGGGSRSVDVSLAYHEETEDCQEVATEISSGPLHEGDLVAGTSFEFELALPADSFPNYTSEHGALYWEIDALSNEAGRDTHERVRIDVEAAEAAPSEDGFAPVRAPQSDEAALAGPREKRRQRTNWFARAFLAAGVLALAFGVVWLVLTVRFVADAERATGTVVDVESSTDADG
jgi:hypothetical protein